MVKKWLDDVRRDAICKLRKDKFGRKKLKGAVDRIMELYDIRQAGGLIALEDAAGEAEPDFLKHLILLTANEVSPQLTAEIATNEYWTNEPGGVDAMVDYMCLRGMTGIQKWESKEMLRNVLLSLMPARQRKEYEKLTCKRKKKQERLHKKEIRKRLSAMCPTFKHKEVSEAVQLLAIKMNELPDLCVQRLVREVDCHDLAGCVYAFDQGTRAKVLENLSTRYRDVVQEEAVKWLLSDEETLAASVNKVIDIIGILKERGEFVS